MQIVQMRFGLGGRPEKTQKGGRRADGHFAVVYFAAGKADYAAIASVKFRVSCADNLGNISGCLKIQVVL